MAIRLGASEEESIKTLFNDLMYKYRGTMPAVITGLKYNDNDELFAVDAKPLINQKVVTESGQMSSPINVITDLPIGGLFCKTLGLYITIPFSVGDECLITCCDRSIDNWQWNGGEQDFAETHASRQYDLNDAVVISMVTTRVDAIPDYSTDKIEIRNREKNIFLSISNEDIQAKVDNSDIVINNSSITTKVENTTVVANSSSVSFNPSGTNALILDANSAKFGVPIIASTGVNIDNHTHSQPNDSGNNVEQDTEVPK